MIQKDLTIKMMDKLILRVRNEKRVKMKRQVASREKFLMIHKISKTWVWRIYRIFCKSVRKIQPPPPHTQNGQRTWQTQHRYEALKAKKPREGFQHHWWSRNCKSKQTWHILYPFYWQIFKLGLYQVLKRIQIHIIIFMKYWWESKLMENSLAISPEVKYSDFLWPS